jgi:homoserine kinase type II
MAEETGDMFPTPSACLTRGAAQTIKRAVAVYTDINDAELESFLAEFDLGRLSSFKGIAEGVSNSNFLLETDRARFILTLYEHRAREEDLPYFLELMHWLGDHGYPAPSPQADRQGRTLKRLAGRPAALVSFLSGVSVKRPSVGHCREAGEALARLHLAAEGFPLFRENTLGQPHWAEMFDGCRGAAGELRAGLDEEIAADLDALRSGWPEGLPQGVIHADFFPDNVFFLSGRFAAAIDFYFAANDALAYDIAVCLNAWCFEADDSFNATKAGALVAGYQKARPLSRAEADALPLLARGAAMRFFLTRMIDWVSTPPGALVKPHDPLVYAKRLDFHRSAAGRLELFAL